MTGIKFSPEVSLGHLIQLGAFFASVLGSVAALVAVYFYLKQDIQANAAQIAQIQIELTAQIQMNTMRVDATQAAIQTTQTAINDKLRFVADAMADLKQDLRDRNKN